MTSSRKERRNVCSECLCHVGAAFLVWLVVAVLDFKIIVVSRLIRFMSLSVAAMRYAQTVARGGCRWHGRARTGDKRLGLKSSRKELRNVCSECSCHVSAAFLIWLLVLVAE